MAIKDVIYIKVVQSGKRFDEYIGMKPLTQLILLVLLAGKTLIICDHLQPNLPTKGQVFTARELINQLIDNNVKNGNEKPFIAGLVRLSFHDCVGHGGCDGCINHQLPSNGGLTRYTSKLNFEYDRLQNIYHSLTMSRADFYVLAGYVALQQATVSSQERFLAKPTFGRLDCSRSPNEDHLSEDFPKPTWNLPAIQTFFARDGFMQGAGFDMQDIVAILGAHSLGRCSMDNSGFEGKWVALRNARGISQSDILDNEYYKQLSDSNWIQMQLENGRWQWQRFAPANFKAPIDQEGFPGNIFQSTILINVDMAIAKDLGDVNEQTGKVECNVQSANGICRGSNCCRQSEASSFLLKYTDTDHGNRNFMKDFMRAFNRMTTNKEWERLVNEDHLRP